MNFASTRIVDWFAEIDVCAGLHFAQTRIVDHGSALLDNTPDLLGGSTSFHKERTHTHNFHIFWAAFITWNTSANRRLWRAYPFWSHQWSHAVELAQAYEFKSNRSKADHFHRNSHTSGDSHRDFTTAFGTSALGCWASWERRKFLFKTLENHKKKTIYRH